MPTSYPSWSEVWSQIRAAVKLLRETFKFGSLNSANLVDLIDDVVTSAKGPLAAQMARATTEMRANLAAALARGRDLLDPCIRELGRIIKSPATDLPSILRDLRDYMRANSKSVVRRNFTRGSLSAGASNVGDGTVYALTTDERGDAIESGGPFVTTLECVADQNTGTPSGAAIFDVFTSGAAAIDLVASGSGLAERLQVRSRLASDGLLANASFRNYTSTATHPFWPWLVSGTTPSYANISQVASGARPDRGTTSPSAPLGTRSCVKLNGNNLHLYQVVPQDLDPNRPYALVLWFRREGGCNGTLYVRLGSKTASVALAAQSGWQRLAFATSSNNFYRNFKTSPLTVTAWLQGRTTGYLLLDEALLAPMDSFNGRWFTIVTGRADFERRDRFTFTDTSVNNHNIQGWLDRLYGTYLPHADAGAATEADPS